MKITIDKKWCKGCGLCIDACQKDVLAIGETRSDRGYLMPEAVNPDACIHCLMCERICPDLCIAVVKE